MNSNALNISVQNLETVKYRMKFILRDKYLPVSPEDEEGVLMFHGLNSWVYRYHDFVEDEVFEKNRISFKSMAVLRKQFHEFVDKKRFFFNVVCVYSGRKFEVDVSEIESWKNG